mmetsp:Transcript_17297/g.50441  ORF Transcript_17297/g.50441 Transcript_17297/m.50441 type:complete len:205 (-) Transcript_17297:26-640(-)
MRTCVAWSSLSFPLCMRFSRVQWTRRMRSRYSWGGLSVQRRAEISKMRQRVSAWSSLRMALTSGLSTARSNCAGGGVGGRMCTLMSTGPRATWAAGARLGLLLSTWSWKIGRNPPKTIQAPLPDLLHPLPSSSSSALVYPLLLISAFRLRLVRLQIRPRGPLGLSLLSCSSREWANSNLFLLAACCCCCFLRFARGALMVMGFC